LLTPLILDTSLGIHKVQTLFDVIVSSFNLMLIQTKQFKDITWALATFDFKGWFIEYKTICRYIVKVGWLAAARVHTVSNK